MGKYYVKNTKTGSRSAESDKEWVTRSALNTVRAGLLGSVIIDAACVRQVWKSNMKMGFKVIGITALSGRMIENSKCLAAAVSCYEVAHDEDEAEYEPVEGTETAEPEQNPEEETEENKSE